MSLNLALASCCLLIYANRLIAASIGSSYTYTQVDACLGGVPGQCDLQSNSNSGSFRNGMESLTYNDSAVAGYGVLHVSSQSAFSVQNDQAWAYGFAAFQDIVTVNYGPATGSQGTMYLQYTLDGTISGSGVSTPFVQVDSRVYAPTLQNRVDDYEGSTSGLHVVPMKFQFIYGTPFALYFGVQATTGTANVVPGVGYQFVARSGSGTGLSDFSNTFDFSGFTIEDSGGSFVPATITSESGTAYALVEPVPEPVSSALLIVGGLGLLWPWIRPARAIAEK